jgi:hypothetical protein
MFVIARPLNYVAKCDGRGYLNTPGCQSVATGIRLSRIEFFYQELKTFPPTDLTHSDCRAITKLMARNVDLIFDILVMK